MGIYILLYVSSTDLHYLCIYLVFNIMNIFIDIRKKFRMTILELLLSSMIYIAVMAIANPTDEEWKHSALNYNSSDCILPLHYEMQFKLYNV